MKRLIASVIAGVLVASGASLVASAPAHANPSYPEFISVNQTPDTLVFDSNSEHLKLVQEMDDPAAWSVAAAYFYVCYNSCNRPSDFYQSNLLRYTGSTQAAQQRLLTFEGDIPNSTRSFSYYFQIVYDTDAGPGVALRTYNSYTTSVYNGVVYYGFGGVYGYGDTRISITGPATIPTGSSLLLSGMLECYGRVGYKAPDYGGVYVEYRATPTEDWTYFSQATSYNQATGAWTARILAVGGSGDWRAVGSGDACINGNSRALHVDAGGGEPPTPPDSPDLPGAPSLTVGDVGSTTAVVNWGPPASTAGITGYEIGWTSASGLPVPSWSKVYANPSRAFKLTNLNPDSDYEVYIEAVTANGHGARATVTVHTDGSVEPPSHVVTKPSPPTRVHGAKGKRKAIITWAAPSKTGGSVIDRYQAKRFNAGTKTTSGKRVVFGGLSPRKTYRFYVRAHNAAGWGPWSRVVSVRPRR